MTLAVIEGGQAAAFANEPVLRPLRRITGFDRLPAAISDQRTTKVPDVIEFVFSDQYLNRPSLYPRQATLLKVIFLQDELFTDYDWGVLEEWSSGFRLPPLGVGDDVTSLHYEGDWGINPDIIQRMQWLKARGHRWFPVVCAVQGRRSGKGHIGSICAAYVLWHYLCTANPQEVYGLMEGKRLASQVFAGKKAQARDNQWRDIANLILSAPCFGEYISNSLGESLTVFSPHDPVRIAQNISDSSMDQATFEIVPKEATTMAARGPASFMQFWDEMAHMVATGVSRSAEEVWRTANPSLSQFKKDSFIYCGSSPWAMMGKFHDLVRASLEFDPRTFEALDPTILTIQLASWDIYLDWEKTKDGMMVVGPPRRSRVTVKSEGTPDHTQVLTHYFKPLIGAIEEYDDKHRRDERANPESFRVEYRSKWATGQDTYFDPAHIDRAFRPWNGLVLEQLDLGVPGKLDYIAHGDPGKCLTAESLMFSTEGIIKIPQVRIGDEIVNSVSTDRVADAFESGLKKVYSLRLKYGYEVRGSEDHPVLTQRGWVRMIDLVTSKSRSARSSDPDADQVKLALGADLWAAEPVAIVKPPVPRRSNGSSMIHCPSHVDDEIGRLFGFIVAEGRVGSAGLSLSGHVDERWMGDCVDIVSRRFGIAPDRDEVKGKGRYLHWYNAHFHELLVMLGMTPTHSRDKEIPWAVLQSPRSVVSAFLRAYFEGDGTVAKRSAKDRVVQVTTASEELARQVQVVLANFGILSQRTVRSQWLDGAGEARDYWNVTLRGDSIRRFNMSIGFESVAKISRAKSLGDFDCAPTSDEVWLPAWSVDDQGEEMTWDLMMESGEHNFAANGIICHNTSSNFGFAIAHVVPDPDGHEIPHVVFDRVHAWTPGDFQTIDEATGEAHYEMDYEDIENDIKRWGEGFLFTDLSFDQWNSISFVQRLGRFLGKVSYKNARVWERTTTAPINWMTAETMKVALSLDRVHMPYLELAELELKFLQKMPGDKVDHPNSGPVTTKDVYDAISIVVQKAIGQQIASAYGAQFSALKVGTAMPGLSSTSTGGSVTGEDTGRPLSTPAVQTLFNRDRNTGRSGARPVPGQIPGHRPGRPR